MIGSRKAKELYKALERLYYFYKYWDPEEDIGLDEHEAHFTVFVHDLIKCPITSRIILTLAIKLHRPEILMQEICAEYPELKDEEEELPSVADLVGPL